MAEYQYPHETIDLPSGGSLYPKDSPLHEGKIDIKYMTAKEEDILTSQNLIQKGVVLDYLLDSLILTEGVKGDDLLVGDKTAIWIASRILAYGPDYTVMLSDPDTNEEFEHTFNLSELPYKPLMDGVDYSKNEFEFELPMSKKKVIFKLLTGMDESNIEQDLDAISKLKMQTSKTVTTRMKHSILSIDGNNEVGYVNNCIDNMLTRDSMALRRYQLSVTPGIDMVQMVDFNGVEKEVLVPFGLSFFWPS